MAPEMPMAGPESGSGAWSALLLREQDGGSLVTDRRWDTLGMGRLGWLSEYSESSLRSALRVAGAGLDRLPIELTGTNDLSHPTWASGSATVDGRFLAKFAFSEQTAVRVWHEAGVLKLLAEQPAFDVPDVVAASPDPACLVTRIVESGVPLSYELVRASLPARVDALGSELARFLASLHARQILALARDRLGDPLRIPEPGLQATDELRLHFTPMIKARERARVRRWCDWVDEQLAAPTVAVFVHGDFHPDTSYGTHAISACSSSSTSKRAASQSSNTTSALFPASGPASIS